MSDFRIQAEQFVDACDGGKGWEVCKAYCHEDATFACQAPALAELGTLEQYTNWAQGLLTPMPDGRFELRSLGIDEERGQAVAYAVFQGTHTADGGPVDPTGKQTETDYVYVLDFDGDRIRHMTKIWNDAEALGQLGWM